MRRGQIFIEPQGMCVMAGIGRETGQAEAALKSVEERLDTPYGVVLLQPAYTTYRLNLGEISSYPPGYKENAGIFCHNNPWISCAETVLGHGDRAFSVYKKTCPAYIEDISEIHRTEPYVYSQMVAGRDAPTFGEAKNSWLTGTAAWTFVNVSQYILASSPLWTACALTPASPHAGRLHRHPPLPGCRVPHPGGEPPRRAEGRAERHHERRSYCGHPPAAGKGR